MTFVVAFCLAYLAACGAERWARSERRLSWGWIGGITVLLGGLKTLSEGRNEYGPPILGKIPYLSRLFRNTAYGRESQSLMIMVTPRIIINEEEEQVLFGQVQIPRP